MTSTAHPMPTFVTATDDQQPIASGTRAVEAEWLDTAFPISAFASVKSSPLATRRQSLTAVCAEQGTDGSSMCTEDDDSVPPFPAAPAAATAGRTGLTAEDLSEMKAERASLPPHVADLLPPLRLEEAADSSLCVPLPAFQLPRAAVNAA